MYVMILWEAFALSYIVQYYTVHKSQHTVSHKAPKNNNMYKLIELTISHLHFYEFRLQQYATLQ